MFKTILTNWELVTAAISVVLSLAAGVFYLIVRVKAYKNAKTQSERAEILSEIKSHAYGLVAAAEQMMSDIPKSGQVKLLYVLNHIQKLCEEQNVPYDCESWTEFINGIIGTSNDVITAKETEKAIGVYIGNGEVIEARGHAYGVVKSKLKDRNFTQYGYAPSDFVTYTSSSNNSNASTPSNTIKYYPKCAKGYRSLVDALDSVKVDSSYSFRKKIAIANGIKNYSGKPQQNIDMLNMLKVGKLKKA